MTINHRPNQRFTFRRHALGGLLGGLLAAAAYAAPVTLNLKDEVRHIALPPDRIYPEELDNVETVDEFATLLISETS